MMKIILTGIFIFIFIILFCASVLSIIETIKNIAQQIRLIKLRKKYKNKRIENKINKLSPNQLRAILGFDPINHPKYKTAKEMLEHWPDNCPKPTHDEVRKYFGLLPKEEKNDRN